MVESVGPGKPVYSGTPSSPKKEVSEGLKKTSSNVTRFAIGKGIVTKEPTEKKPHTYSNQVLPKSDQVGTAARRSMSK